VHKKVLLTFSKVLAINLYVKVGILHYGISTIIIDYQCLTSGRIDLASVRTVVKGVIQLNFEKLLTSEWISLKLFRLIGIYTKWAIFLSWMIHKKYRLVLIANGIAHRIVLNVSKLEVLLL